MSLLDLWESLFPGTPAPVPSTVNTVPSGSADYTHRVAMIESGGNPNAKAPGSSALGLFQFTTATWESVMKQAPSLDLTEGGRTDPTQATKAFVWLTEQDDAYFAKELGRQPADNEKYLLHPRPPTGRPGWPFARCG